MQTATAPFSIRQSITQLLLDDPKLVFELASRAGAPHLDMQRLGQGLTIRSVETEYPDPSDPHMLHRTDLVLVAHAELGGIELPVQAVIVEVFDREDPTRPPSWPVLTAAVRERYGCPAQVVILAMDPQVRRWAQGIMPRPGLN